MPKSGKVWGTTEEIFNNGIVSINYLKIKVGGFCSEHRHIKKANLFFVVSGTLRLEIWKEDGKRKDETILGPGQMSRIEPGDYHRFWATSDVECFEIYDLSFTDEDIERRTIGGIA
jgi:mannose-6-phosphate isomerase-like protein (cupin superfamily)